MALIGTRAATSARGFGLFSSVALSREYWLMVPSNNPGGSANSGVMVPYSGSYWSVQRTGPTFSTSLDTYFMRVSDKGEGYQTGGDYILSGSGSVNAVIYPGLDYTSDTLSIPLGLINAATGTLGASYSTVNMGALADPFPGRNITYFTNALDYAGYFTNVSSLTTSTRLLSGINQQNLAVSRRGVLVGNATTLYSLTGTSQVTSGSVTSLVQGDGSNMYVASGNTVIKLDSSFSPVWATEITSVFSAYNPIALFYSASGVDVFFDAGIFARLNTSGTVIDQQEGPPVSGLNNISVVKVGTNYHIFKGTDSGVIVEVYDIATFARQRASVISTSPSSFNKLDSPGKIFYDSSSSSLVGMFRYNGLLLPFKLPVDLSSVYGSYPNTTGSMPGVADFNTVNIASQAGLWSPVSFSGASRTLPTRSAADTGSPSGDTLIPITSTPALTGFFDI